MPIRTHVEVVCQCHKPPRPGKGFDISINGIRKIIDACEQTERTLLAPLAELHANGRVYQEAVPAGYVGDLAKVWPNAKGLDAPKPRTPARKTGGSRAKPAVSTQETDTDVMCPVPKCGHRLGTQGGIGFHMKAAHLGLTISQCLSHVTICGFCGPEAGRFEGSGKLAWHMRREHNHIAPRGENKGLVLIMVRRARAQGDPHGALNDMDNFIESYISERRNAAREDSVAALAVSSPDSTEVGADHLNEGGH